jgi:hypothetical protein
MQNWNKKIQDQLNDLPGFPPVPTGSPKGTPATAYEWILGDWIDETRVRPGAALLGDLPLVGNTLGDVRFVIGLGAWYWWGGATWSPVAGGGGVATVTATAPISSSLGANPNISFPSWPANAPGALTNNGAGGLSWVPAAGGSRSVTFPSTVSASSTTQVEAGAVKLTFTVSPGAVGCECCVFSASPTRARIIVTDIGTVPIFLGSFVEDTPKTGLRTLTASVWSNYFAGGWIRVGLDQIHGPIAPVILRGVFFVES